MANELLQPGIRSGYEVNGPAAGVMADQQYQNWLETQSRVNRDSDLAYMDKSNTYQNALLDNPVKAATRSLDLAKTNADLQTLPGKVEETLAKQIQGKTDAQLKTADDRAAFMYSSAQAFEQDTFTDPVKRARGQRIWDEQKAQAKELGVKMPESFDPDSLAEWQQKGQASGMYLKHRQAMELEKSKEESAKAINAATNTSREKAAQIAADAASGRAGNSMTDINRIITEMDRKVKSGEPLTQEDIEKAKVAYKANKTPAEQAPLMKARDEASATFLADPAKAKAAAKEVGLPENASPSAIAGALYDKALDQQADEWVKNRFPGAKVTKSSGAKEDKGATQPKDKAIEQAATASFGSYEPDKYEYVYAVNPATGRKELGRKAKKK